VAVFGGFFSSNLLMLFLGMFSLVKTIPPTSALVTFVVTGFGNVLLLAGLFGVSVCRVFIVGVRVGRFFRGGGRAGCWMGGLLWFLGRWMLMVGGGRILLMLLLGILFLLASWYSSSELWKSGMPCTERLVGWIRI